MFAGFGAAELRALARLFRPRLLVPDEVVIRKGERGNAMFLISSGAVEVVLPNQRVRLGSGDFFGELAVLSGGARPGGGGAAALSARWRCSAGGRARRTSWRSVIAGGWY